MRNWLSHFFTTLYWRLRAYSFPISKEYPWRVIYIKGVLIENNKRKPRDSEVCSDRLDFDGTTSLINLSNVCLFLGIDDKTENVKKVEYVVCVLSYYEVYWSRGHWQTVLILFVCLCCFSFGWICLVTRFLL